MKITQQLLQEIIKEELINVLQEEWSAKYKRSINCKNPKGFSQRAHCQGRKKNEGNDPKTGTGKKPEGSGRRLYTDENPKDTVSVKFSTAEDIRDTLSKESFKSKSHARQSQIINLIHQRVRAAHENAKDPEVKARLKRALDYAEKRKEASKKKTASLQKEEILNEKCWEGYTQKGMKTMFGKKYPNCVKKTNEEVELEERKLGKPSSETSLRDWFKRKGAPGKKGGWVDCNTCRDGKCKPCGRQEGEKRGKYPRCRPTPSQCKGYKRRHSNLQKENIIKDKIYKTQRLQDNEENKDMFLRIGDFGKSSKFGLDSEWQKETGKNYESGVSSYFLRPYKDGYMISKPLQSQADYGLKDYFENMFTNVLFDPIMVGNINIVHGNLIPVYSKEAEEYFSDLEKTEYSEFYDYLTGTDGEPLLEVGTVKLIKKINPITFMEKFYLNESYRVIDLYMNNINKWIDKEIPPSDMDDDIVDYLNDILSKRRGSNLQKEEE